MCTYSVPHKLPAIPLWTTRGSQTLVWKTLVYLNEVVFKSNTVYKQIYKYCI